MTDADDHAAMIREMADRLSDVKTIADRARIVGVKQTTMSRWLRAVEAGEDPSVPLIPQTLLPLQRFLESEGRASLARVASELREMARFHRERAEQCERLALEVERSR